MDRPACPDAKLTFYRADGAFDAREEDDAVDIDEADPETGEEISKRKFDAKQRRADAKSGIAMKDGSFPIEDKEDLENAIRLAGKAKNPAAARAHIKRRAKALGAEDMIPETWKDDGAKKADVVEDPMAVKKNASDQIEKAVEPAPIAPTQVADVMADGAGNGDATAVGQAVAGKKITPPALPDGGPATSVAVPNEEEAGQATPDPLNETETAAVEHVAPETPKPGKDKRTRKQTAAEADAVSSEPIEETAVEAPKAAAEVTEVEKADDPVAAAHAAADAALKAAAAVMQRLAKREAGYSSVLAEGMELRKGLAATARLGYLLCELAYCLSDAELEKQMEGDDSQVPAKLHAAVETLAAAYKAMSDEELQELLAAANATMSSQIALACAAGDLVKAFDGVVDADALAKLATDSEGEDLSKAVDDLRSERDKLLKTMGGLTETVTVLAERFEALADQPQPAKTVMTKAADPRLVVVAKPIFYSAGAQLVDKQ